MFMVDGKRLSAEECRAIFRNAPLVDRQEQVLELIEGERILDIGCYAGNFIAQVQKKLPLAAVYGVDYFPDHISIAKVVFPELADRFSQMSAYQLGFDDGALDCVTLQEVLEHLEGAASAVKEINRVLGDGGLAIVTVPNPYHLATMIDFFKFEFGNRLRRWRGEKSRLNAEIYFEEVEWNRHIYAWTPPTLLTLFAMNGFEYVEHRYERPISGVFGRWIFKMLPFLGATQILKIRKVAAAPRGLV